MLVLTRKLNEEICIGDGIKITLLSVHGQRVRLGVSAENDVRIQRAELITRSDSVDRDGEPEQPTAS